MPTVHSLAYVDFSMTQSRFWPSAVCTGVYNSFTQPKHRKGYSRHTVWGIRLNIHFESYFVVFYIPLIWISNFLQDRINTESIKDQTQSPLSGHSRLLPICRTKLIKTGENSEDQPFQGSGQMHTSLLSGMTLACPKLLTGNWAYKLVEASLPLPALQLSQDCTCKLNWKPASPISHISQLNSKSSTIQTLYLKHTNPLSLKRWTNCLEDSNWPCVPSALALLGFLNMLQWD